MPAFLLLCQNTGPAPVPDLLLELLPTLIGMEIHSCSHGGVAKGVVANNYILCDRLNHGSLPHYQFTFELPDYFLNREASLFLAGYQLLDGLTPSNLNPVIAALGFFKYEMKIATRHLLTH